MPASPPIPAARAAPPENLAPSPATPPGRPALPRPPGAAPGAGGQALQPESEERRPAASAGDQAPQPESKERWPAASARPPSPDPAALAVELERATYVKKGDFSLAGLELDAKVVDVYDGDTIRVSFHVFGRLRQFKARMAGYDSPEMSGSGEEKRAALAARDALAARLGGKCVVPPKRVKAVFIGGRVVRAVLGKFDKYGRLLITLHADGVDLNRWMVEQGHGYPYSGGTKKKFGAA